MNYALATLSLFAGLVLTATGVSLFALHRAHLLVRQLDQHGRPRPAPPDPEIQEIRSAIEDLGAKLHDLDSRPAATAEPIVPRSGFNLNKRSQALRMHRRGESIEQIAAALERPRQEIELLLRVQGIVLKNLN